MDVWQGSEYALGSQYARFTHGPRYAWMYHAQFLNMPNYAWIYWDMCEYA